MKLVRFGSQGEERPGVWLDDYPEIGKHSVLDVRAMAFDIEDYDEHFFERDGIARLRLLMLEPNKKTLPANGVRLGSPLARPGKIICMGGNYREHCNEIGAKLPVEPVLFNKAASAITGAFDDIMLPPEAQRVDAEAELAVVIGRRTRNIRRDEALSVIAGFMVLNDVSDRDAQYSCSQWFRGKSADTFCPVGPFLVTPDDVPNPHNLAITQKLNGEILQSSNTSEMIFDIAFVISYISATITLLPGDIISTGTPSGVGASRIPPISLKAGDVVEVCVEKLGCQRSKVV